MVRPPHITLAEVDILAELLARPQRPPDYEAEREALAELAKETAENPRNMLQKLAEIAVRLCAADTAGISLMEGDVFRWEAMAGASAAYRDGVLPRDASPCGICINRDATQLMRLPGRFFPAIQLAPLIHEVLLVPFHVLGKPAGTVWILAQNPERKFDREDERIVRTLAQFASTGWQLWKAYEAAVDAARRKDDFMAMLGHELRNPLGAIVAASEILKTANIQDPQTLTAARVISRQSHQLSRLADDLIDLSRIGRGTLELEKESIELQTVLSMAVEAARVQIDRRSHTLSVRVPTNPIRICGDPDRLAQLFTNLLDNAAKYTPSHGEITISADAANGEAWVIVADTGIGIPQDRLKSIFELFTRVNTKGTSAGGLGIGLALVQTLVELHGGSVEVKSELGQGSQFLTRLPAQSPPPEEHPPKTSAKPESDVSLRILVVEDDPDQAESLKILLTSDGHTIHLAKDGPAALNECRAFRPDAVLLDLGLPGMSGYQLAKLLRKESAKNLMIIALSGYGRAEDHHRSREAGCDHHIVKPAQIHSLRHLLRGRHPSV